MKNFILILLLVFGFAHVQSQDPTFCLDLEEVSNDGTTLVVKLGIMGSMPFDLGSSNLQFSFDQAKLTGPTLHTAILPSPNYQLTVTEPVVGEASLNIYFAFPPDFNFGSEMSDTEFTFLANISFSILENTIDENTFSWSYNGGTTETVVYQDTPTNQIFATDHNPATCLITLPVDLLRFDANLNAKLIAELTWDTRFEIFLSHFEIERSVDQKNWEYIGMLYSNQVSDRDVQHYGFDDDINELLNKVQVVYYRVKLVDQNGFYFYSPIEAVHYVRSDYSLMDISIHPNPTNGIFTVLKNSNEVLSSNELVIYDSQGEKVFSGLVDFINGAADFDEKSAFYDLPAGTYNIVVIDKAGRSTTENLIIQK